MQARRKFAFAAICVIGMAAAKATAGWPTVPPADFSKISIHDFADDEIEMAPALFHFHTIANSVVETGPTRGFIGIKVWRDAQHNQPFNARVLENHVALAFFYTQDRKWNPYRGSEAVRDRLEAILELWINSQNEAGLFAEYGPTNYSLAPTSFGVRHMALTLEYLESGGPTIDRTLLVRLKQAQRKAIVALIGTNEWAASGRYWSNQYSPVFYAALSYDKLYGDPELLQMLKARLPFVKAEHQSPAGYMYESAGPDHAYTFGTHVMNARIAWPLAVDNFVGEFLAEELQKLFEWGRYNYIREPDGSGFYTNFGVSTRTAGRYLTAMRVPMADRVPQARALSMSDSQIAAAITRRRSELAEQWGVFKPLAVGASEGYTPRPFTDIDRVRNYPTQAEQAEAVAMLPYLTTDHFNRQFADSLAKFEFRFTFVRRPGYFASFNSGKEKVDPQRFGLGIIWNDRLGAVFQTQAASNDFSFGTIASGGVAPYEARALIAQIRSGGTVVRAVPGKCDLPDGELVVEYADAGVLRKSIAFAEKAISVSVEHPGDFSEQLPLLMMPDDSFVASPETIVLTRQTNGTTARMIIRVSGATGEPVITDGITIGKKVLRSIRIPANQQLKYTLSFE